METAGLRARDMKERIAENLQRIRDEIAQACDRDHRDPREVELVAVTKTADVDAIGALLDLGHAHIGESRVQELVDRHSALQAKPTHKLDEPPPGTTTPQPAPARAHWHMVGHLQRNKVKPLLPIVEMIHSVDSLRLAEEINTTAARLGLDDKVHILLQVNTSREKQKHGLAVGAVLALAEQVMTLPNLKIGGLMTMAPLTEDAEKARFCFGRLREIFEEIRDEKILGPTFKHLSMGMSNDYIPAIEEGATLIRIGSALFE